MVAGGWLVWLVIGVVGVWCLVFGGWLGGWVVGWLGGWVVGWLGGWVVGWLGGWVVGWLGGWVGWLVGGGGVGGRSGCRRCRHIDLRGFFVTSMI